VNVSKRKVSLSVEKVCKLENLEMRRLLHGDHGAGELEHSHDLVIPGEDKHAEENCSPCLFESGGPEFNLGNKWGSSAVSYGYSNLFSTLTSDMTDREIRDSINEALLVWSAVSPLRFTEAADPGGAVNDNTHSIESPQIRIGTHFIDGASGSNVLAHAYGPGSGRGGDLHFDSGNTYNRVSAEYFIEVAAHEIGHAIGLGHANGDVVNGNCPTPKPAIMDACIQSRYGEPGDAFLLADDIAGVQAHYGAGLGYVLESGGNMYVSGTQNDNTFFISSDGSNITINSQGFGSFTRSLSGINSITVYGRGGNDTFWVDGVPASVELTVDGAAGNDVVQIGDQNYDNNILGNVVTNLGAGNDEVVVGDILDEAGSDVFTFDLGFKFRKSIGGEINFNGDVETFSLVASGNNDIINVLQVPVGTNFILSGWGGNDTFNIGNGDFDFWVGGDISITGVTGTDTLNILDADDGGADTYTLDSNTFSKSSEVNTVQFATMETVNINAASGDYANIFNLTGGPTDGTVNVDAGDGDDVFNVGGNSINNNAVNTIFNLDGQVGSDVVNFNDGSDIGDTDVYTINANSIIKTAGAITSTVNLTSVSEQVINASNGGTQINGNGIGRMTTINGGGGNDTIDLDDNYSITINNVTLNYATVLNTGTGDDNVLLNDDNSAEQVWASFDQSETLGTLNIGSGGLLTMLPNGLRHLSVNSVVMNGRLNLYDNLFIRRNYGAGSQDFYRTRLQSGYNNGAWNGAEPSIYSTTAAGNSTRALGYALKSDATTVTALGTVINPNDLVIKLTQKGDADLDRDVDFDDLLRLAQNYGNNTGRNWFNGDFDYDAGVDFDDLLFLAQRYSQPFAVSSPVASPRKGAMDSLAEKQTDLLA
jgi:hypothetical protein